MVCLTKVARELEDPFTCRPNEVERERERERRRGRGRGRERGRGRGRGRGRERESALTQRPLHVPSQEAIAV